MESHQGRSGSGEPDEKLGDVPLEEDDWALAIQGVTPMKDRGDVEAESEDQSAQGALADRLRSRREPTIPLESDGTLPAIDRRTAERLRRGQIGRTRHSSQCRPSSPRASPPGTAACS
jgi:hypothetical protein